VAVSAYTLNSGFPPGAEVRAYERTSDNWPARRNGLKGRPRSQPPGPVVATATMTADGAGFDLAPGRYWFAAHVEVATPTRGPKPRVTQEWQIVGGTVTA
jgi:hypothetical protein